jgi:protein-S-isoprenylcysteine O-methyltransferase Ste14
MPTAGPAPSTASLQVAWAGAAVFLVSLLWSVYAFLVDFDRRPPRLSAGAAVTFDVALFTAFALHHSVLARSGPKRLVASRAPVLERSLYTWTASLLFIMVCGLWETVPGTIYVLDGPWRLLGYAAQAAGAALTLRSSAALDVLDLAGVRQVQRARAGTTARITALETGGLYGMVRHPLYSGWALMVCGSPDMTATRATFAVVSTAYLMLAIPWEERSLVRTFGQDYEAYRRRVRWRMVPGLY